MKFEQVKELIELVDNSKLSYFEVNLENAYIKMDKSLSRSVENLKTQKEETNIVEIEENKVSKKEINEEISVSTNDDFCFIKSPIVGTFYKASSPESEPFVKEGQSVKKGEVLCIVEAMKLMNEINAEFDFEVISVLVNDGDMVEYNQDLFKVRRK